MNRKVYSILLGLSLAFGTMFQSSGAQATTFNLWRPACHTVTLTDVQGPFEGIYGSFVTSRVALKVGNTTCKPLNEWTLLTLPTNIDIDFTRQANPGITFNKTLFGLAIKTRQEPGTDRNLIIVTKRPVRVGQGYLSQGGYIVTAGLVQAVPAPSVAFGEPRSVVDPTNNSMSTEFANGFTANRFAVSSNSELENTIYTAIGDTEGPKLQLTQSVDFGDYLPPVALVSDPLSVEFTGAVEMDAENNVYSFYSKADETLFNSLRLHVIVTGADGVSGEPVQIFPEDDPEVSQLHLGTSIDGLGHLHVATSHLKNDENAPFGIVAKTMYARSEDGGTTWSQPIFFESPLGLSIFPSVVASADGSKVMVAYYGTDGTERSELRVATSVDGGNTFSTNVEAHHGNTSYLNPFIKLAMDASGNAYLSASDDVNGDGSGDLFVISSENGVNWSSPSMANDKATNLRSPIGNMAVGPNGEIDVFWHSDPEGDDTTDTYNHTRSVDGGVSFTASQALASGGLIDVNGRGVRYDLNGHVHVQYAFSGNGSLNEPSTVYEVIGQ